MSSSCCGTPTSTRRRKCAAYVWESCLPTYAESHKQRLGEVRLMVLTGSIDVLVLLDGWVDERVW